MVMYMCVCEPESAKSLSVGGVAVGVARPVACRARRALGPARARACKRDRGGIEYIGFWLRGEVSGGQRRKPGSTTHCFGQAQTGRHQAFDGGGGGLGGGSSAHGALVFANRERKRSIVREGEVGEGEGGGRRRS
jgi:hypothetical protein